MRRGSLYDTHPMLLTAATLTAALVRDHATGFLPKDIEFYFELYGNWLEARLTDPLRRLEFVQISRWLKRLEAQGFVETSAARPRRRYHLTNRGISHLVESMLAAPEGRLNPLETVFVVYVLRAYRPLLEARLPVAAQRRLDARPLIASERRRLRAVIDDLERRLAESEAMSRHAREGLARGAKPAALIREIDRLYGYQLGHRKTLSDLYAELPEALQVFELETGIALRNEALFRPQIEHYRGLEKLLVAAAEGLPGFPHKA
jgi:DNA-binding PadR family transcriptional regulator